MNHTRKSVYELYRITNVYELQNLYMNYTDFDACCFEGSENDFQMMHLGEDYLHIHRISKRRIWQYCDAFWDYCE